MNENEKDETSKMGQSWAISDEKWSRSRLTIGQGSKCIKCERNDNMGDRVIHNLLIIFKCLLRRYKIDNLLDEYYSIISEKNRDITKNVAKDSARCMLDNMQEIFDGYGINASCHHCQHRKN